MSKFCEYVQVCMFARVLSLRTTNVCNYGRTFDHFSRFSFHVRPRGVILGSFGAHFGMVGPIRGQDAPRSASWRPKTNSRDLPGARSVPKGTARGTQIAPNHDSGGSKSGFWRRARLKVPMCVFHRFRACGGSKIHFLRSAKPLN